MAVEQLYLLKPKGDRSGAGSFKEPRPFWKPLKIRRTLSSKCTRLSVLRLPPDQGPHHLFQLNLRLMI